MMRSKTRLAVDAVEHRSIRADAVNDDRHPSARHDQIRADQQTTGLHESVELFEQHRVFARSKQLGIKFFRVLGQVRHGGFIPRQSLLSRQRRYVRGIFAMRSAKVRHARRKSDRILMVFFKTGSGGSASSARYMAFHVMTPDFSRNGIKPSSRIARNARPTSRFGGRQFCPARLKTFGFL